MQTQADLRVGSLVVWHGADGTTNEEDIDDVGVVVSVERCWDNEIQIFWSVTNKIDHFCTDEVEESLYQRQMEIISANSG